MRRPVRMMTFPSTSSRRIRLGEPTSSLPSGVIVAALIPRPASRIAPAASVTQALPVSRRFSSERSWCSSSTRSPVSSASSTRIACRSSSCPVSSPSSTTIRSGSCSGMRRGPVEVQLVGVLLERGDHEREVLVEVHAELLGALPQLVAVHRGGERGRLHLLLHGLRGEPVDARGPHVGAGHDETAQLVDGVQRLLHVRVARHAQEVRVRRDADSVHSQKRDQASGRESSRDMVGTLAQLPGRTGVRPAPSLPPLMEKLVIEGGVPLSGTIVPAGNKNAALPILAACLLTDEQVVLHNVPQIRDADALVVLLQDLGVKVERGDGNTIALQADKVAKTEVDPTLAERIRASFLVAGPLLARFGDALLPPPGGDVIGRRRLDPHLDAFRALGAHVEVDVDIRLTAPDGGLQACDFFMDEPSVMGTENALMAAALTPGSTIIRNAASEPHV